VSFSFLSMLLYYICVSCNCILFETDHFSFSPFQRTPVPTNVPTPSPIHTTPTQRPTTAKPSRMPTPPVSRLHLLYLSFIFIVILTIFDLITSQILSFSFNSHLVYQLLNPPESLRRNQHIHH
jgi:hypothetical protein